MVLLEKGLEQGSLPCRNVMLREAQQTDPGMGTIGNSLPFALGNKELPCASAAWGDGMLPGCSCFQVFSALPGIFTFEAAGEAVVFLCVYMIQAGNGLGWKGP